MNTPTIIKAGLVGTLAAAAAFALGGSAADAHGGLPVVNVPHANPRFGVQNNVLTPSATRDVGRLGQPAPDEPRHRQRGHALRLQHARRCAAHPDDERGPQDRARQERLPRPRRQALPLPGPRDRSARLRHAHQPRRDGPAQAGHAHLRHRPGGQRLPDDRRHHVGPVHPAAAPHGRVELAQGRRLRRRPRRERRPGRRRQGDAPARPRLGWLRGHPERRRRQRLDRRGHRRRGRRRRQGAQQLRLPLRPDRQDRPHQGRHAPGPADPAQRRLPGHDVAAPVQPVGPVHRRAAHLRLVLRHPVGHHPHRHDGGLRRHGRRQGRRRDAAQAPRERRLPSRHRLQGVLLHRDRRHEHLEHPPRRVRRRLPHLAEERRAPTPVASRSPRSATRSTPASTTSPSRRPTTSSSSRTPATACTPSATRWTPATSSTSVTAVRTRVVCRRPRSRSAARAVPRRGP